MGNVGLSFIELSKCCNNLPEPEVKFLREIEAEQRMVTRAAKMPVIRRAFLLPVSRAF